MTHFAEAAARAARPLKDSFSRVHSYLRLSLTERCSLRCVYCMPAGGVDLTPRLELLTAPELGRLTSVFASRGVEKIRLTGGEPLVRSDAVQIAERIGAVEGISSLGITTNGLVLQRKLEPLLDAGVRHFNVSLDTLVPAKFELITRRPGHARVVEAVESAAAVPDARVKVNVVVMKGVNEEEVVDFAGWTEKSNIDVRFIEYMPFAGNRWSEGKFVSYPEMLETIAKRFGVLQRAEDGANSTSKHYRIPGFKGRVGFISSMTDHFCGSCNRLRITADGNLKVCLFGSEEVSLRDAMRDGASDTELNELIDAALFRKHWALGGSRDRHEIAVSENRSMIRIGG